MKRYLLAAEADQIQDFVFRPSALRSVVGGSQLLEEFCSEGPRELGVVDHDVLVAGGGSFRLLFSTKEQAEAVGRRLQALYRLCCDSELSVGEPADYETDSAEQPDGFRRANRLASERLRRAKHQGDPAASPIQMPLIARCACCGRAHAAQYARLFDEITTDDPNYLCECCKRASDHRLRQRDRTFQQFIERLNRPADPGDTGGPHVTDIARTPEAIGARDSRRYVAYLAADGNGMGAWFSACPTPDALRTLSRELPDVIWTALAQSRRELCARVEELGRGTALDTYPVLPLIVGGDEVFALIAAPWALDFALGFARFYQIEMQRVLQALDLDVTDPPTIAVAVVICKQSYPHRLARERAEALLAEAKKRAKRGRPYESAVHFDLVESNALPSPLDRPEGAYRATRKPSTLGELDDLLAARLSLMRLPGRRRNQLRMLFDELRPGAQIGAWEARLEDLVVRIERDQIAGVNIRQALRDLGDGSQKNMPWCSVVESDGGFLGHGLPDLFEAWHYAYRLGTSRREYQMDEDARR
jgi:hypothetical protein